MLSTPLGDLQLTSFSKGNNGLGKETVLRLAKHNPSTIFLCSRSQAKGDAAIAEIKAVTPSANVKFLELDLNSFASAAAAASSFTSQADRLDILVNNAGIMAVPEGTTKDGYEVQLGVNHMGHALLTKLLLPTMLKTAEKPDSDVRIINLSSGAHTRCPAPGIDYDDLAAVRAGAMGRYSRSKLANIYFTNQLAQRYPSIKSVAIHPGLVQTNLFDTAFSGNKALGALSSMFGWAVYRTVEDGAKNQLWAATAPKGEVESGAYYTPVGEKNQGSAYARDAKEAAKLWDWTEAELKKHGY